MGTRAIIEIYDEHGVLLLIIYSQYDGHLSSLGKDLADFLRSGVLTRGIGAGEARTQFNGAEDVATRCVCYLKRNTGAAGSPAYEHAAGGVYIMGKREGQSTEELAAESFAEYMYTVTFKNDTIMLRAAAPFCKIDDTSKREWVPVYSGPVSGYDGTKAEEAQEALDESREEETVALKAANESGGKDSHLPGLSPPLSPLSSSEDESGGKGTSSAKASKKGAPASSAVGGDKGAPALSATGSKKGALVTSSAAAMGGKKGGKTASSPAAPGGKKGAPASSAACGKEGKQAASSPAATGGTKGAQDSSATGSKKGAPASAAAGGKNGKQAASSSAATGGKNKSGTKRKRHQEADPGEDSVEYEVESILGERTIRGQGQVKVHWKGFPVSEASWELASSFLVQG
eukprot:CAMPEP_0180253008 /NCGR_PEP_ID=MMETSP0987-20121128/39353_1 /TAXON_ID=697907 /ORGANISM="non described non described, Strain CCMP2293" /LENGTH=401 /DNA_ID=CAMNT_0022221811 /DNA_START=232 /DNA_END=1437 /DNA_ORIENTATION=+